MSNGERHSSKRGGGSAAGGHEAAMRIDPILLVPLMLVASPAYLVSQSGHGAHRANPAATAYAELLQAERAFSDAAASRSPAEGIAAMFDEQVQFPTRDGFAQGRAAATAALAASPASRGTGASWRSIGGGVSADGSQGFTYGYLDVAGGDPARARRRYLAYWIRRPEGWRVLAFRQLVRRPDEAEIAPVAPLIAAGPAVAGDADTHARAVAAAERAFSDRAQQVGLRAAFLEYGHDRAVHVATPAGFAVGLPAIGANFDSATTSPLNWSTDRSWAAASGDLGLSVGTIQSNGPVPEDQPASAPFFTIWIRDSATGQWRYIAE